jgi:hypothetical protein
MTQHQREAVEQNLIGANRQIWVTFQKAGYHRYPAAGVDPRLDDVSYLAHRHRHLFKFRVSIQVWHTDRELEFHQVLNHCESLFDSRTIDIDFKSVEMLADDLYLKLTERYGTNRNMEIEVSEDGECGCLVRYPAIKEHA